jgi:hypothetical protein
MRLFHPSVMTGAARVADRRHVRSQKQYHPRQNAADHAEYTTRRRRRAGDPARRYTTRGEQQ